MVWWPRAREGIREHGWGFISAWEEFGCGQGFVDEDIPGRLLLPVDVRFFIFQFATAGRRKG